METWEIVFILALVTISLIVLVNHNVPASFINLLDNSLFQLAIVGLTLAVAVVSPPVSIIAIATIVIVYYIRNLIKVQLINNIETCVENNDEECCKEESDNTEKSNDAPQLIVEEVKTVETTTTRQHVKVNNPPVQQNNVDNDKNESNTPNENTKPEDMDVLESALKADHDKTTGCSTKLSNYKIPSPSPIQDIKQMEHEMLLENDIFSTPRNGNEGFTIEPINSKNVSYGTAPSPGTINYLTTNNIDLSVGTSGDKVIVGYNELSAPPTNRQFSNSEGQYEINETRPSSNPQKYEIANFFPGNDMGTNDFAVFGESIDDKISNLKSGIVVGSKAPLNFDEVVPSPIKKIVN
jgi:hypothetical protein